MTRRLLRALPAAGLLAALLLAAVAPAAVLGGGGCHRQVLTESALSKAGSVSLVDACFEATVVRIEPGGSVTWTNEDSMPHAVTGAAGSFGTYDELPPGASVRHTFEKPGTYPYFCVLHPSMVGAVVVGDGILTAAAGTSAALGGTTAAGTTTAENTTTVAGTEAQANAAPDGPGLPAVAVAILGIGLLAAVVGYGFAMLPRRRTSARYGPTADSQL